MNKLFFVLAIISSMVLGAAWQTRPEQANPAQEKLRGWLITELERINRKLSESLSPGLTLKELKDNYFIARRHYKHVEFFVEYCSPREAKYLINGPLVPKHDEEQGTILVPPRGFQRIEELLFTGDQTDKESFYKECISLKEEIGKLQEYYRSIQLNDNQFLEMCQLELFRITAMNLNGYDATISQTGVQESAWCMEGIEQAVNAFSAYTNETNGALFSELRSRIASSKKYLRSNPDYVSFNRLEFITRHINVLNKSLVELHSACKLPWSTHKQALNLQEKFLFGRESFNLNFFSMYYDDTLNLSAQAELGKILFFDPVLSGNNQRSCAGCHIPAKGFTDGLPKGIAFGEAAILPRNTPSLLNVIYQKAFFYDGKAYQLEQQISDVISNPHEMQSSLSEAKEKLRKDPEYRRLFAKAFSGTADTAITPYALQKAITEYEKTLISFNSPFDKYLRGDKSKLNAREINGYNLFAGKGLCGSCHFLPLFNGTVPPHFNDSEFEVIGTPADSGNKVFDTDEGRYNVTKLGEQKNAFKTPTVRNAEITAPYMHNGAYTTLEQVVEFYHKGGGAGLGFQVPNQTLPFDSLQLSPHEKEDIVLFLKTLTDTSGFSNFTSRIRN